MRAPAARFNCTTCNLLPTESKISNEMVGEGPKVVLITGGSAGIGKESAVEFAKMGYRVAITGRDKTRMNEALEKLRSVVPDQEATGRFLTLFANFELEEEVDSVVEAAIKQFGRLDVLINNAGYPGKRLDIFHSDFYEDFKNILQVNLMAATRIAQLAAPHLIKTRGVIINVSSVADRVAMPTISYSVSKAGLSMLTKTLANALEGKEVRVVTVSPGPIATNFAPTTVHRYADKPLLGRVGESDEVAKLIVFLASDKASYIHGTTIDIDGGLLASSTFLRPTTSTA